MQPITHTITAEDSDPTKALVVRKLPWSTKNYLKLEAKRGFEKTRPATCFRLLEVPEAYIVQMTPQSFELAKKQWVYLGSKAREAEDKELEVLVNLAWQRLKEWRCPFCGWGKRERARDRTCGRPECIRKSRNDGYRKYFGDLRRLDDNGEVKSVLKMHELHIAARARLVRALENNNHNTSATARELRMDRHTLWHYMKKYALNGRAGGKKETLTVTA